MATKPEMVLLRPGKDGQSKEFTPEHAKRLLALKGTVWQSVADEVSGDGSGKKPPTASGEVKTGEPVDFSKYTDGAKSKAK